MLCRVAIYFKMSAGRHKYCKNKLRLSLFENVCPISLSLISYCHKTSLKSCMYLLYVICTFLHCLYPPALYTLCIFYTIYNFEAKDNLTIKNLATTLYSLSQYPFTAHRNLIKLRNSISYPPKNFN